MESTLADVKYMFNVKAGAAAGLTPENIPNNTFGILNVATGLTIAISNSALAAGTYQIVSKVNNKTYMSPVFKNTDILMPAKQPVVAGQGEKWEAVISCCSCIDVATLNVVINSPELTQQHGMTWTTRDSYTEVSPAEMKCHCSCDGKNPVYENFVMTILLHQKVLFENSPYYTSHVYIDADDIGDSQATAPATPTKGDIWEDTTGSGSVLKVYDGSDWVVFGTGTEITQNFAEFLEAVEEVNTDSNDANWMQKLTFEIESLYPAMPDYADLEAEYVYPRITTINPSIKIEGACVTKFTKTQNAIAARGEGVDLRAEEFDNMRYYTNLMRPLVNGTVFPSKELKYQFENQTTYDVINFEIESEKVERNGGKTRRIAVMLGVETGIANLYNYLATMFGA